MENSEQPEQPEQPEQSQTQPEQPEQPEQSQEQPEQPEQLQTQPEQPEQSQTQPEQPQEQPEQPEQSQEQPEQPEQSQEQPEQPTETQTRPRRIYNHLRDRTTPELHHTFLINRALTLPKSVDLRTSNLVPNVLDQGDLGSCGANALSNVLRFCMNKEHVSKQIKETSFQPSRLFIYYFTRKLENSPLDQDTGITLSGGLYELSTYSACSENNWGYDISKFAVEPPQACINAAKTHIRKFQCKSINYNTLVGMKQCLSEGFPFVFGITVFESFESEASIKTGNVPVPDVNNEQMLGGHAMNCVGYDDTKQVFIVQNSWGSSVGDKGFFYIPYAYMGNADYGASDIWTIRFFE